MLKKELVVSPEEIYNLNVEKGWYDTNTTTVERLCLIHSEISEALEAYRNDIPRGEKGWMGEELADATIRIFDLAFGENIDIVSEIEKKHKFNKTRPYRHGNKRV